MDTVLLLPFTQCLHDRFITSVVHHSILVIMIMLFCALDCPGATLLQEIQTSSLDTHSSSAALDEYQFRKAFKTVANTRA